MQPRYFPMLQTRASRMTGNSTNETPTLVSSKICAPRNELVRLTFPPVDVKVLGRVEECEISEFLVSIVVSIPACHAGDGFNSPTGSKGILLTVPNTFDLALFEMHEASVSKTRP